MLQLVCTEGQPWSRRTWEIRRNPQDVPVKRFTTPTLFAGYSVWGNQWSKLAYFYQDWRHDLSLLLSIYDIYRAAHCLRRPLLQKGFSAFILDHVDGVRKYVQSQRTDGKPHGDYIGYFPEEEVPPFAGLLMVDSGGFSFGSHDKLDALRSRFDGIVHGNRSERDEAILAFAHLMLEIDEKENDSRWSRESIRNKAQKAQIINLENQLAIGGDFIITLDRVIDDYDYSLTKKRRRAAFSLECAKAALAFKAEAASSLDSLLLAAVHPIGPSLSEAKALGRDKTYSAYRKHAIRYLAELAESEEESGSRFDGLAVGSLVPVQDYNLLKIIADALWEAILESPFENRFVHVFGATNNKARFLFPYGVDSFDTTYHLVRGRNRFMYDPEGGGYVATGTGEDVPCRCRICSKYPWERITESREGVREVATVLQSLHNLYAGHMPAIESLGTMKPLDEMTPIEFVAQPAVEGFVREVLRSFDPQGKKVLVILPCSAEKPYRASRTQRMYVRAIGDGAGHAFRLIDVATLSGVFGIVPRSMEDASVLQGYDFSLNRSAHTRGFHKEVCNHLSRRVNAFLEAFGDRYEAVLFYGRDRYQQIGLMARSSGARNVKVLPTAGLRLQQGGLDELRETVRSVICQGR